MERKPFPKEKEPYTPCYEGVVKGYALNFIRKNIWRVRSLYDFDDLLQDSYELFLKVEKIYPGVSAPHFMALFKSSLRNHFFTLSHQVAKQRTHVFGERVDWDNNMTIITKVIGDLENEGVLRIMVSEAPKLVKDVLDLVQNKREYLEEEWQKWRANGGKAEAGNAFLCSVLKINPSSHNVVHELKEHFIGVES